jgi:outer membrane protein assembly factor BamA
MSPNPDEKRWNYRKGSPLGWVRGRLRPFGQDTPFEVHAGYALRYTRVEVFENSLLAEDTPLGLEGGFTGQLQVGALWDTRDLEGDPSSGGVEELSLRMSSRATGSDYRFSGVTLSSRRFFSLIPEKLVLAQRVLFDTLWGDVPFFEWAYTGGLFPAEGVGGMSSVRGIMRNRYVGLTKAFLSTELRYYPWTFSLFNVKTKLGGLLFVDFGRTWHPQRDDGTFWNWHPAAGVGLRLARRQAVVRTDVGYAFESSRLGVFVTFGHMF